MGIIIIMIVAVSIVVVVVVVVFVAIVGQIKIHNYTTWSFCFAWPADLRLLLMLLQCTDGNLTLPFC